MNHHFEPENRCKVCQTLDCENEMCLPDAPMHMIGDEDIPQLGSEESGRFFQPLDYVQEKGGD